MARTRANVTIRGTRPFLHHAFGPHIFPELGERKVKTGVAGNDPVEWKKSFRATEEGQLFIHYSQVWASIRDGAQHSKKGKGNLKKTVVATLLVEGSEQILTNRWLPDDWKENGLIQDNTQDVYLDVRGVRNPNTRGANLRYRIAMAPGWEASFTISWDNTILSDNSIETVLKDAGTLCGIGDGRNIGMGRFEILNFELLDT